MSKEGQGGCLLSTQWKESAFSSKTYSGNSNRSKLKVVELRWDEVGVFRCEKLDRAVGGFEFKLWENSLANQFWPVAASSSKPASMDRLRKPGKMFYLSLFLSASGNFSPVCLFTCVLKLLAWEDANSHWLHLQASKKSGKMFALSRPQWPHLLMPLKSARLDNRAARNQYVSSSCLPEIMQSHIGCID